MGNAPAREGLLRSVPFRMVRADEDTDGDGLTLTGYAAVFDIPTEIDSWEGSFTETIRKGAFRKSIRERTPVLQFDHGHHPLVGSIPIGKIQELSEDNDGLWVSARLSDNWLIEPVRDAIREEAVEGMSFRFTVIRDEWRDKDGKIVKADELMHLLWEPGDRGPLQRTLIELRVPELGPVVFPAYEATSVGVRARSLATLIRSDDELRREVRASLAREAPDVPDADREDLTDPAVRRDVARALLFQTADAPPDGHPSDTTEAREDAGLSHAEAAPPDGHPADATDAPPPDGHPSAETTPSRTDRLRAQIREITGLMDEVLAPITKDD